MHTACSTVNSPRQVERLIKNMVELDEGGDDRYLRKAMFYGYGGPGWGGTFNGYNIKSIMEKYGCSSETRAMQHYLVDYLYDGESGLEDPFRQLPKIC